MQWLLTAFEDLYRSIESGSFDASLFQEILPDLKSLNLDNTNGKSSNSRIQLQKGEISLSNGEKYKINEEFSIAVVTVADELKLDELVVAEIMLLNENAEEASGLESGISLVNSAKVWYYLRRQYILQICSYILNCRPEGDELVSDLVKDGALVANVIEGFKAIEKQLREIKEFINKGQILDNYDAYAKQNVTFRRNFLLKEYDTLSQVLYGLVVHGEYMKKDLIYGIIERACELDSDDFFIVFYIPAIFYAFSTLEKFPDANVKEMHKRFLGDLRNEATYQKPIKATFIFAFLTHFIGWCKLAPASRAKTFDFATDVDEPMALAVEMGAIEELMIIAAETSELDKDPSIELFYDIRTLLERHLPRLIPKQMQDMDFRKTGVENDAGINGCYILSQEFLILFEPAFHRFLQTFIAECAFLLTKMKDAEEDSLLSGEDLFLDDISAKADLERVFITVHYFYAFRPTFTSCFWSDKESNAYGFIEWAMKCTDTLMRSCVFLMISSLAFEHQNSINVYHYISSSPYLSWINIANIVSDYTVQISEIDKRITETSSQSPGEIEGNTLVTNAGLNEEIIILLSSLFTLVGSVSHDLQEEPKNTLAKTFMDIFFEFLKVKTPLIGAALKVLGNLVPADLRQRDIFWCSLDEWIFRSQSLIDTDDSYRSAFQNVLTDFSDVSGFLHLVYRLLSHNDSDEDAKMPFGQLPFCSLLGASYRKAGLFPYYDFIFKNIFINAQRIPSAKDRVAVELTVLRILDNSLRSFDSTVILNSIPAGASLDSLVITEDFFTYVVENPATAVFNYVFEEKVFQALFGIASVGVDVLQECKESNPPLLNSVELALKIIDEILTDQETHLEELCPIVKKHCSGKMFLPKSYGLHGLRSFFDAIMFDMPLIAHLGLYIGVDSNKLALRALNVLQKLSEHLCNRNGKHVVRDRLLAIFDSVDESARIKQAFINQLEKPVASEEDALLKIGVLDFLSSNLPARVGSPTVSHFLLGFLVSNVISLGPKLSTFISSGTCVLQSLIHLLKSSLEALDPNNITYLPMRLSASIMEIILKLCRNPLTSTIALQFLGESRLFEMIISLDPMIDLSSQWCGMPFKENFGEERFSSSSSMGAFLSFLKYRSLVLQFFSLDIHRLQENSQRSSVDHRTSMLTLNYTRSPRIFSFLDPLGYTASKTPIEKAENLTFLRGIEFNLDSVETRKFCSGPLYDFSSLVSLVELKLLSLKKTLPTAALASQWKDEQSLEKKLQDECVQLQDSISNRLSYNNFSSHQLSLLHSWVQLVEIVVLDGSLAPVSRSNFILDLFEAIVPKINDYVDFDISYSEELVSLCVFLFDIYQKDREAIDGDSVVDSRLHSLFKACLHGITSPLSTLSLRSDFYIICNRFLLRVLKEEDLARHLLQSLKMMSERMVEVICNDAIAGEGSTRITGILFLDALVQIASLNKVNFILESLTKSNMLFLITRSVKNTDELLNAYPEGINLDHFLYELTAFKSTAHFMIRIAETRRGARALVQNEIFQTIMSCKFLQADPDLGLELNFNSLMVRSSPLVRMNLNLHNSLTFTREVNDISLFEVLVPIFQLLTSIVLSMGSANQPVLDQARKLLMHFKKLVQGVIKQEALLDSGEGPELQKQSSDGLRQLVKLVILLCTLTGYQGEDA
ncbi:LAMI_0D03048g1_1 [Lachancea mirantina]|uniref:LAMI_0D03048g1_1 n=1 Tax=Lachancea mirantina TaxID=1230905 RepID=A0A1G4J9L8_9SACH|nr:LAMI_0D03048g1_1 [Lachancea mirantina]